MEKFPKQSFINAVLSIMYSTRDVDSQNEIKRKLGIEIERDEFIINCERIMDLLEDAYEQGRSEGRSEASIPVFWDHRSRKLVW